MFLGGHTDTDYSIITLSANIHVSALETSGQVSDKGSADFTNHSTNHSAEYTPLSSADKLTDQTNRTKQKSTKRKSTETKENIEPNNAK